MECVGELRAGTLWVLLVYYCTVLVARGKAASCEKLLEKPVIADETSRSEHHMHHILVYFTVGITANAITILVVSPIKTARKKLN